MRLQVFLSRSGVCSRRKALELIKAGQVEVNDQKILEPSYQVEPVKDTVLLNKQRVSLGKELYLILNKPCGVVTTLSDKFAERKVIDLLPAEYRHLKPAGRLDKDTSGLLLFTNDGELIYRLTHPRFEVKKVYQAVLDKPLTDVHLEQLEKGIYLEGKLTAPCNIRKVTSKKVILTLREGRKRQIRLMFAKLGYQVQTLKRIKQASLSLGDLAPGKWRLLTPEEVKKLRLS